MPTEYLVALLAAAGIVGLAKGGLSSVGSLAVPLLALVMNPVQAAAILLPVYIATDWIAVWVYRRDYSGRNLAIFIPGILIGLLVATLIMPFTPESALLVGTGLIGLWYCLRNWLSPVPPEKVPARVGPGLFWGTLTGITSFITHSGAAPAQAYLLPQRLPRLQFAGTIAISFSVCNLLKLPGYYAIGQLEVLDWKLTFGLIAVGWVGTLAGRRIVGALSEQDYLRIIEILLFVLSVFLIGKGIYIGIPG